MLNELNALLEAVPPYSEVEDYRTAVVGENVLLKQSYGGREETYTNLRRLYGLDERQPLFSVFRALWRRDVVGRPLLALLAACAVDEILRTTSPFILGIKLNGEVVNEQLAAEVAKAYPGRYNQVTLAAIGQRTASSWTQSGHLRGKVRKVRRRAVATPGTAAFALFIGTLSGERGHKLFGTLWAQLLDVSEVERDDLAVQAARQGYLTYKRLGDVAEVGFDPLLSALAARRV